MKVKVPIEFEKGLFKVPGTMKGRSIQWSARNIKHLKQIVLENTGHALILPTYTDIINDSQSTFPVRCVKGHRVNLLYIDDIYKKGEVHRRCDILVFEPKYWKRCLTAPKTNFKEIETSPGRKLIVSKRHK